MYVVKRTNITVIQIGESKEMGQKQENKNSFWIPVKKNKIHVQEKTTRKPATFQASLRPTLIIGQAFSLIPVSGVFSNNAADVSRAPSRCFLILILFDGLRNIVIVWIRIVLYIFTIRKKYSPGLNETEYPFEVNSKWNRLMQFVWMSWKCLYLFLSFIGQIFITVMCIHKVVHSVTSLNSTTPIIFYGTTCITMMTFLQVARSWPSLVQHVASVEEQDPNFDKTLAKKCGITCGVVLTLALLEHILSLLSAFAGAMVCFPTLNLYEGFVRHFYPWVFNFLPYSPPLGILTQFLHFQSTFIWNFSDLFVICISYYLTSTLEHVNNKLLAAQGRYLPEIFWRTAREDYGRAAQLVRKVDDVISGIVFISFANNLFFICLQLFNTLENGIKGSEECSSKSRGSKILGGYEAATYFLFSLVYLITRSVAVSLIASQVNTASTVPAPVLYDVPSPVYCVEVQRFLDQVNGEKLALSGLQFFSVTRSLLLTVAGTIVTYELVMFQFTSPSSTTTTALANVTTTSATTILIP